MERKITEATLNELIALAHQRGGVSMEDLRQALPVDDMTIEEISDILARLDEAGFDFEIDPALLLPTSRATAAKATIASKCEQKGSPEMTSGVRRQPLSPPTPTEAWVTKKHTTRSSKVPAPATMLPWMLAFVIVVLACFAVWAF
jgi:Sigma-70 factor, region 1.1